MKHVIGGALLLFLGIGLIAWNFMKPSPIKTPLEKVVASTEQQQEISSAWFEIQNTNTVGRYQVVVQNPNTFPVQSVQAIIQYPSELLEIKNLSVPKNPTLELVFPGEAFGIDEGNGIITITAGYAGKAQTGSESFVIAEFDMQKKNDQRPAFLSFSTDEGTSQIIVIQDTRMQNILDTTKLKKTSL